MKVLSILVGLGVGIMIGYSSISSLLVIFHTQTFIPLKADSTSKGQVIGFLPYSLLKRAQNDYSKYTTTLAYFALTIDKDGTLLKLQSPQEEEPGWYALESGIVTPFLTNAKNHSNILSLVLYNGDNASIDDLLSNPTSHADSLVKQVSPLMRQYGFSDLNLDIESTKQTSASSQQKFITFVKKIKDTINSSHLGTLTVDVSTADFINSNLIRPEEIGKIADYIIIMGYDYHSTSSFVTGPIAPLQGAGKESEYDVTTAVQIALSKIPREKIILGIPLYGYEWDTIGSTPRSSIIAQSGQAISNRRAEAFLESCASCSAQFDIRAQEPYTIYKDTTTDTYHQSFYPNKNSTESKVQLANSLGLSGLALWALGYEGQSIMTPLINYRK